MAIIRLDNIETSSISCDELSPKWRDYKERAKKAALALAMFAEDFKSAQAVKNCGNTLIFGVTKKGSRKVIQADFCKHPLCPLCAWRKGIKKTKELEGYVLRLKQQGYRFFLQLVPTLKNTSSVIGTMDRFKKAWRKLSCRKIFKDYFDGYYLNMEYTYSEKTGWHCHAHVLVAVRKDLNFPLPAEEFKELQDRFSSQWLDITGDSFIFGVRSVRNLREFAKYINKGIEGGDDLERIAELAKEIKNRQLTSRSGCFRSKELSKSDDNENGFFDVDDLVQCDDDDEIVLVEVYIWNNFDNCYIRKVYTPSQFKARGNIFDKRSYKGKKMKGGL